MGGDVVIRTSAFGATDRAIGVRGSELEASGTLLKVNFLLPGAREDLGGEHDDRGIGKGREDGAVDVFDCKGDIGADVGGGDRSDSPVGFLDEFSIDQKRMRTLDLLKEALTRPQRGRVLFHFFGIRFRRNVSAGDKGVKDFGEGNGLSKFGLGHVRRIEKGNNCPFSVGDVGLFGVVRKGDQHITCLGPVGHHSANMVRVFAGTIHLVSNHLGEEAGPFRRLVFRGETKDSFLIVRERSLSLGASAGATRTMRGSGGSRLSKGRLGLVDGVPRGRVWILILIILIK